MRARKVVAAAAVLASTLVACSADDDGGSAESASTQRWCDQLDELWAVTARLEDVEVDSAEFTEAMAALDEQMATLDDVAAPDAIADDWDTVRAPATTDATGRIGVDEAQEAAGDRVAAWALEHCELTPQAREALED